MDKVEVNMGQNEVRLQKLLNGNNPKKSIHLAHCTSSRPDIYPESKFRLWCNPSPQDNFSWVLNCLLGPPRCETRPF